MNNTTRFPRLRNAKESEHAAIRSSDQLGSVTNWLLDRFKTFTFFNFDDSYSCMEHNRFRPHKIWWFHFANLNAGQVERLYKQMGFGFIDHRISNGNNDCMIISEDGVIHSGASIEYHTVHGFSFSDIAHIFLREESCMYPNFLDDTVDGFFGTEQSVYAYYGWNKLQFKFIFEYMIKRNFDLKLFPNFYVVQDGVRQVYDLFGTKNNDRKYFPFEANFFIAETRLMHINEHKDLPMSINRLGPFRLIPLKFIAETGVIMFCNSGSSNLKSYTKFDYYMTIVVHCLQDPSNWVIKFVDAFTKSRIEPYPLKQAIFYGIVQSFLKQNYQDINEPFTKKTKLNEAANPQTDSEWLLYLKKSKYWN